MAIANTGTGKTMTQPQAQIQVSPDGHYLVTAAGEPFFWLGDTAWELFHRLNRQEAETYFDLRSRQGFNVIQAVILAEIDGLHTPNATGHVPLLGDDPTRLNEYYFRHVDDLIRLAAARGLYIGLLPTWGDKVHGGLWGCGPLIFNEENARAYGEILGKRYRDDTNILWILGGDRPADGYENTWAAMAEGIRAGLGGGGFITYHPSGGGLSTSTWLQDAGWLDMHMLQSGHVLQDAPNWETIAADVQRSPARPVLDAEPCYEGHPIDPFLRRWLPEYGRYDEYDVRRQAYRAVFAGACGHTYGHHSVWQFWSPAREPINFPMPAWDEAIHCPGARQMVHLKNLMLSRHYISRVPAPEMLPGLPAYPPPDISHHHEPLRAAHAVATRCKQGSYGMVYFPNCNQTLELDLRRFASTLKGWWYDPRNGAAHPAGDYPDGLIEVVSPIGGPDWVLVLDAAGQGFDRPGA